MGFFTYCPAKQRGLCCRNQNPQIECHHYYYDIIALEQMLQLQQSQDLGKGLSFFLITATD